MPPRPADNHNKQCGEYQEEKIFEEEVKVGVQGVIESIIGLRFLLLFCLVPIVSS